jgi:hypothetical protein
VGCRNLGRLPQLGFLIFFDKIFLVNLINHNLSGIEISAFFNFFWDFFEIISILEVEIGRNGPRILGVNNMSMLCFAHISHHYNIALSISRTLIDMILHFLLE